jgi:hypothetical protein
VGVLIGATACGTSNDSGGSSPSNPAPSTPTVSPADLDPSTYQRLSPRDYALLVKDPDANKNRKIIVYGVVTQFDAATGNSELRATTGAQPDDYATNTIIDAPDPSIVANVVKKDEVTMWCKVKGSLTYKMQNGGETTVPQFLVFIIKDAGSSGN